MKHLKSFNESIDEIKNEIKQAVEDCFLDYITDYGMTIQFVDGFYVPGYLFMSEIYYKTFRRKYPKELQDDQNHKKCIKVYLHNESIGDDFDQISKLNIHLDEKSKTLFDESIHNLKAELKMITNYFRLEDLPENLSPELYGIKLLIIYE